MDVVNEENKDEEMTDHTMASTSTPPMRSSARLAAKLKKLTETDLTPVPMMIKTEIDAMDIKDLKKRAWATTSITGMIATTKNGTQIQSLEVKKMCNDKTPPCPSIARQIEEHQDATMEEQELQPDEAEAIASEESLQEKEKPPDNLKQLQAAVIKPQAQPQ